MLAKDPTRAELQDKGLSTVPVSPCPRAAPSLSLAVPTEPPALCCRRWGRGCAAPGWGGSSVGQGGLPPGGG